MALGWVGPLGSHDNKVLKSGYCCCSHDARIFVKITLVSGGSFVGGLVSSFGWLLGMAERNTWFPARKHKPKSRAPNQGLVGMKSPNGTNQQKSITERKTPQKKIPSVPGSPHGNGQPDVQDAIVSRKITILYFHVVKSQFIVYLSPKSLVWFL